MKSSNNHPLVRGLVLKYLTSKSKITKMSVVKSETAAFKLSVSLVNNVLNSLDLGQYKFEIYFFTDSMPATAFWNPSHQFKCIVTRNVATITTKFMQDATNKFEYIQGISLAWVRGVSNISDKLTRFSLDAVDVTNSEQFRCGPAFFRDDKYPAEKFIFDRITKRDKNICRQTLFNIISFETERE